MKTDLQTLKDTFKFSYDCYRESRAEGNEVEDMFHNRQYTHDQLAKLTDRGQPAETFNIIKLYGRLLLGYYSTVVNTVKVTPMHFRDTINAALLNDVVNYIMRDNQMETEGDKIKLDALTAGLMCSYQDVEDTGVRDEFGRPINRVTITHVPWQELVIDPLSKREDYSDGRFIHRWKWVSEETIKAQFKPSQETMDKLVAYFNHIDVDDADFERNFSNVFEGYYKRYDNYLLVHSVITDENDRVWSVYWCGDVELDRKEVTFREVKFPYRIQKVHISSKAEHYGIFREVVESQKAINQALLKIQLMANSSKTFVENGGVEDIEEFADMLNRVNAVIPVKSLAKIKVENLTREVLDQYTIIDKAFERIQRVLGVNDSFLGMAFASDSGRKVKLQQNATTMSLRYITVRIDQWYRLLGWDTVNLVKQYYTATQVLRITDDSVGARWVQINKPMMQWTGQLDAQGQPVMRPVFDEVLDPASGEPMKDENGNLIIAPVPTGETEIEFTNVNVDIDTAVYNDEDEKNQIMMETMLSGVIGSALLQANPAGFMQAASLLVKTMKTRHSMDISSILEQTGQAISGGAAPVPVPTGNQSPKSSQLKLPSNTNEEA